MANKASSFWNLFSQPQPQRTSGSGLAQLYESRAQLLSLLSEHASMPVINQQGERELLYMALSHSYGDPVARARAILSTYRDVLEDANSGIIQAMKCKAALAASVDSMAAEIQEARSLRTDVQARTMLLEMEERYQQKLTADAMEMEAFKAAYVAELDQARATNSSLTAALEQARAADTTLTADLDEATATNRALMFSLEEATATNRALTFELDQAKLQIARMAQETASKEEEWKQQLQAAMDSHKPILFKVQLAYFCDQVQPSPAIDSHGLRSSWGSDAGSLESLPSDSEANVKITTASVDKVDTGSEDDIKTCVDQDEQVTCNIKETTKAVSDMEAVSDMKTVSDMKDKTAEIKVEMHVQSGDLKEEDPASQADTPSGIPDLAWFKRWDMEISGALDSLQVVEDLSACPDGFNNNLSDEVRAIAAEIAADIAAAGQMMQQMDYHRAVHVEEVASIGSFHNVSAGSDPQEEVDEKQGDMEVSAPAAIAKFQAAMVVVVEHVTGMRVIADLDAAAAAAAKREAQGVDGVEQCARIKDLIPSELTEALTKAHNMLKQMNDLQGVQLAGDEAQQDLIDVKLWNACQDYKRRLRVVVTLCKMRLQLLEDIAFDRNDSLKEAHKTAALQNDEPELNAAIGRALEPLQRACGKLEVARQEHAQAQT